MDELSASSVQICHARSVPSRHDRITFEANAALGSPTSPVTITASNQIISKVFMSDGWNWFSLNVKGNMSTASVMATLVQQRVILSKVLVHQQHIIVPVLVGMVDWTN
jgi:hypothetical protein